MCRGYTPEVSLLLSLSLSLQSTGNFHLVFPSRHKKLYGCRACWRLEGRGEGRIEDESWRDRSGFWTRIGHGLDTCLDQRVTYTNDTIYADHVHQILHKKYHGDHEWRSLIILEHMHVSFGSNFQGIGHSPWRQNKERQKVVWKMSLEWKFLNFWAKKNLWGKLFLLTKWPWEYMVRVTRSFMIDVEGEYLVVIRFCKKKKSSRDAFHNFSKALNDRH